MVQRVAVEEFIEIDHRRVGIKSVVRIRAFRLGVLVLYGIKMVSRPIDGITELGRVLDDEVVSVASSYNSQRREKSKTSLAYLA